MHGKSRKYISIHGKSRKFRSIHAKSRKSKISAALSGPGLECSPLVIVMIRDQRSRGAHDVTLHWSPETQKYLVTA